MGFEAAGPIIIAVGATAVLNAWLWVCRWAQRKANEYVARYKSTVVQGVVRFIDPALTYEPDSRVPEDAYKASGLFPRPFDRYTGDDCVRGRIGRTPIVFSEVHAEYKTTRPTATNRTKEVWHAIFHGLLFVCEFNKTFTSRTFVLPDKLEKAFGEVGAALQLGKTSYGELVKLEDPEFERLFTVYGTDQIGARYVLSTSLMARLTEFRQKTRQEVRIAFADSNLYVAVSFGRDMFEPRIWRSIVDYREIRSYFDDLQLVIGIVEDLNLNTRIWGERALEP